MKPAALAEAKDGEEGEGEGGSDEGEGERLGKLG